MIIYFISKIRSIFDTLIKTRVTMFDFNQYLGFLAFMTIVTIGFWLMIFLISILPYWIGGNLYESWKLRRKAKKNKEL